VHVKASGHGALHRCWGIRRERSLGQFLVHGASHRRPRLHRSELQSTLSWRVCWTHLPLCEDKQSLQSEHNEPKTPGTSGYPHGKCLLADSRTDLSRSTPGIRSRCQRHSSHTLIFPQTPRSSIEVCEVLVSCIVPAYSSYLGCQHAGASSSDTLRSRWAGNGRCICRAHTLRGDLPCHKQVPLSCVVQLSTSLASMAVDEKAFAIHSMHKVALGNEDDRRGSTRHPSLKSHWDSWGGRHEYMGVSG
jgi:hypothetical protein